MGILLSYNSQEHNSLAWQVKHGKQSANDDVNIVISRKTCLL